MAKRNAARLRYHSTYYRTIAVRVTKVSSKIGSFFGTCLVMVATEARYFLGRKKCKEFEPSPKKVGNITKLKQEHFYIFPTHFFAAIERGLFAIT